MYSRDDVEIALYALEDGMGAAEAAELVGCSETAVEALYQRPPFVTLPLRPIASRRSTCPCPPRGLSGSPPRGPSSGP